MDGLAGRSLSLLPGLQRSVERPSIRRRTKKKMSTKKSAGRVGGRSQRFVLNLRTRRTGLRKRIRPPNLVERGLASVHS